MSSTATGCWRSPPTTAARWRSSARWTAIAPPGKPIDFWSLRLPAETRAYVPKLLAMKRLVVADPESYGLSFSPIPNQPYFARGRHQGQIDLQLAAEIAGVSPMRSYTSSTRPSIAGRPIRPGPFLLLPADAAEAFRDSVDSAHRR